MLLGIGVIREWDGAFACCHSSIVTACESLHLWDINLNSKAVEWFLLSISGIQDPQIYNNYAVECKETI
jgi:hypothetical protein